MPRKQLPAHLRRPVGRPTVYPWKTWFDGQVHIIEPVADFDCDVESMRQQVYLRARKDKVRVVVRRAHEGLAIQAVLNQPVRGAAAKYNWDHLLDGNVHQLNVDRDITGKVSNFRIYARSVARDRGQRLVTRLVGNLLILQAFQRDAAVVPAAAELEPAPANPLDELPFAIEDPLVNPRPFG